MPSVLDGFNLGPPAAATKTHDEPVAMRAFDDMPRIRQAIFDNTLAAASHVAPVTNQRHTLSIHDVKWVGPARFTSQQEEAAILTNQTLHRRLQGTLRLTDNATGQPLAEKTTTLAHVPYLTDDGTFVHNGNQYTLSHQSRLRPGVFTRFKENGELEAHVNVMPGKGLSHHVFLDPATGVFKLHIAQAKLPLIPLLKAMGASHQALRQAWGDQLLAVNMQHDDPSVVNKLYARFAKPGQDDDSATRRQIVADAFTKMQLDPAVTKRTLGHAYDRLNLDAYLNTTKKLLAVSRGEAQSDDRDHMAFQQVYGPEDLLPERIAKDHSALRNILWKASARQSLDHVQPGVFSKSVGNALLSSGLGNSLEEVNPAELLDQHTRVTRMGEGGIPSPDSVPAESRSVQPSQLGFIDFLRTPERGAVGVDTRVASQARKGQDGQFYIPVKDLKSGQLVWRNPDQLASATIVFPGELQRGEQHVTSLVNGQLEYAPRDAAHYELQPFEHAFSPLANMIPLKSAAKGQRVAMGARFLSQALPLVHPEAPLVQTAVPGTGGTQSFEELYGRNMGAVRATQNAEVTAVGPHAIDLRQADGTTRTVELHHNMPYNRKTFLHHTPLVRPGDSVQAGQLLAHSNFTTPQGTTALGLNPRVAYTPFRGLNFEDANVISESFAKRATSQHMYQHALDWEDNMKRGKDAFVSLFPAAHDRETLEKFDDHGVIKPGTIVQHGDPLVLVAAERERSANQVHNRRSPTYVNKSVTWEHHTPGVVTDAPLTDKGVNVVVKSHVPAQVGDKLSGRYGNKGVIAQIIPDHEMPADQHGQPFELLANPLGLISRTNVSQVHEAALGKIAAQTGQPYKVEDFGPHADLTAFVAGELAKHGLQSTEPIYDPQTGRRIRVPLYGPAGNFLGHRDPLTGRSFMMKLHHTSESKNQGRGLGGYTLDGMPAKGGPAGAKRIGMLELNALLSHGATDVLRDVNLVRGQANPTYWAQYMAGYDPPTPATPLVYQKFVNQLKGAGINVVRDGTKTHIMALTNHDVSDLAGGRELQNAETVDWHNKLQPLKGGLFDENLTGGHNGNRWSQITLHEPMPNPVMEEPIRHVLGLTENELTDVIAGRQEYRGQRGPQAIQQALDSIDLPQAMRDAREQIVTGRKGTRDAAVKRLKYLKSAEQLGIHPRQWMLNAAPVLPPAFRPVAVMGGSKLPMVSDPNYLYKELFDANQNLKHMSGLVDDVSDERAAVYGALKGVTGLGDPIHPKNQERNVKGILRHVFGSSPKLGVVQRRLLGSAADLVGRAVITPNPELDMDHVGLPEAKAWEVYKPAVVRNLVRRGLPGRQALQAVRDRTSAARQTLVEEMEKRPVLVNRAPTLHRYGMMAFWPQLVKGDTLHVSPLVVGGFGADFDGDAMQYHVPVLDAAVTEAVAKMLPSSNLLSAANFKSPMFRPTQEYAGGLHTATALSNDQNAPKVFVTAADAVRAFRRGDISSDQRVKTLS